MLQDTDNADPDSLVSPIDPTLHIAQDILMIMSLHQGLKVRKFERDFDTSGNIEYTFVNAYPFSISAMPFHMIHHHFLNVPCHSSYLRYVIE